MIVEQLHEGHIGAIKELDDLAFCERPKARVSEEELAMILEQGMILGVFYEGKLVSNIQLELNGSKGYIAGIVTDPDHSGKGLAKKLLNSGVSQAEDQGIYALTANVRPNNAPSVSLFTQGGFCFDEYNNFFFENEKRNYYCA